MKAGNQIDTQPGVVIVPRPVQSMPHKMQSLEERLMKVFGSDIKAHGEVIKAARTAQALLASTAIDNILSPELREVLVAAMNISDAYLKATLALQLLIATKKGKSDAIPTEWTSDFLEDAITEAKAKIHGMKQTKKIEHALSMLSGVISQLEEVHAILPLIGSLLTAMWSWTHDVPMDVFVPGANFGLVVGRDVVLDNIRKPKFRHNGGWHHATLGMPLLRTPGTAWGVYFYDNEAKSFFHKRSYDAAAINLTSFAGRMSHFITRKRFEQEDDLRLRNKLMDVNRETKKKTHEDFAIQSGLPFPVNQVPIAVVNHQCDFDEDWQGDLYPQLNIAVEDRAGFLSLELLNHHIYHRNHPRIPFGFVIPTQMRSELIFSTLKESL